MKCYKFMFFLALAAIFSNRGVECSTNSITEAWLKFEGRLKEFTLCITMRLNHKASKVLDCLKSLKLESDPYWNLAIHGQGDSEFEKSGVLDFIKYLQEMRAALTSSTSNTDDLSWAAVQRLLKDTDGSGDREGSGSYGHLEGSGSYGHQEESGSYGYHEESWIYADGSGHYGGLPDDEDSGSSCLPDLEGSGAGGQYEDLIRALKRLRDIIARATEETEPNSLPCIAPYVDIAYKMCILPILDKVFSYDDALEHCRERGLQLVMDSVVIKSRKYLNELLGERGTRTRWPVWVGAKKQEGGESRWMWEDGNTVPNFLWSKRQPRTYNAHSIPEGTCMILDGFNEYYGSSLPCHLRRRFICQKTY